ncbi:uncharacterized protein LOC135393774 [Ornithodoros turicata]|uniref:uncharacterized protein LOC135393774 n=1 Tax=Ornithodoros turicata TaxID=34597 RepID=UPI00313888F7
MASCSYQISPRCSSSGDGFRGTEPRQERCQGRFSSSFGRGRRRRCRPMSLLKRSTEHRVQELWEEFCEDFRRRTFMGVTWDFQVYGYSSNDDPRAPFIVPDPEKIPERLQRTIANACRPAQLVINVVTLEIACKNFFPCLGQTAPECSCKCCATNQVAQWLANKVPESCHVISTVSKGVVGTPVSTLSGYFFKDGAGTSTLFIPSFPGLEIIPLTMDDMFCRDTTCFQSYLAVIAFVPEEAFSAVAHAVPFIDIGSTDFVMGAVHSISRVRNHWFAGLGIRGANVETATAVASGDFHSTAHVCRMLRGLKSRSIRRPVEFAFMFTNANEPCFLNSFTDAFPGVPIVGACTQYCAALVDSDEDGSSSRGLYFRPKSDVVMMVSVDVGR